MPLRDRVAFSCDGPGSDRGERDSRRAFPSRFSMGLVFLCLQCDPRSETVPDSQHPNGKRRTRIRLRCSSLRYVHSAHRDRLSTKSRVVIKSREALVPVNIEMSIADVGLAYNL